MCAVTRRTVVRAAAVSAAAPLALLLTSAPAQAVIRDDGDQPGTAMSFFGWVGLFIALPTLLFAVIALLVYLPSMRSGPRYRPGVTWFAAPAWFGERASERSGSAPVQGGGGASARW